MKNLHAKAIKAYIDMLTIHIDTKTTDSTFHEKTEGFYETLFEVAHTIWEKHVDLGWSLEQTSLDDKKKQANNIIINLRKEIENYKDNNEVSLWTEDLLWSLANNLESDEWVSRSFLK